MGRGGCSQLRSFATVRFGPPSTGAENCSAPHKASATGDGQTWSSRALSRLRSGNPQPLVRVLALWSRSASPRQGDAFNAPVRPALVPLGPLPWKCQVAPGISWCRYKVLLDHKEHAQVGETVNCNCSNVGWFFHEPREWSPPKGGPCILVRCLETRFIAHKDTHHKPVHIEWDQIVLNTRPTPLWSAHNACPPVRAPHFLVFPRSDACPFTARGPR